MLPYKELTGKKKKNKKEKTKKITKEKYRDGYHHYLQSC